MKVLYALVLIVMLGTLAAGDSSCSCAKSGSVCGTEGPKVCSTTRYGYDCTYPNRCQSDCDDAAFKYVGRC